MTFDVKKALTAVQCTPRYSHLKAAAAKQAATIAHAEMWTEARTFDHSSNSQQTYYWNKVTRETRWVRCFFLHTCTGSDAFVCVGCTQYYFDRSCTIATAMPQRKRSHSITRITVAPCQNTAVR